MRRYVNRRPNQNKLRVVTTTTRRKLLTINTCYLMRCMVTVMSNLIDAGIGNVLSRFKLISNICHLIKSFYRRRKHFSAACGSCGLDQSGKSAQIWACKSLFPPSAAVQGRGSTKIWGRGWIRPAAPFRCRGENHTTPIPLLSLYR